MGVACQENELQEMDNYPKTIYPILIWHGSFFEVKENLERQNFAIKTKTEWANLLEAMNFTAGEDSYLMSIDFSKSQIIAVFDRSHPGESWSIDITDITEYADSIVVTYTNLIAGEKSSRIIQPFHIVEIPASDKRIVFQDDQKEIPFTEYSLVGTQCIWKNLPYDGTVLVINSSEELEKYIFCTENIYPVIDFSKYTLLLASGAPIRVYDIVAKDLYQFSKNKYELSLKMNLNNVVSEHGWCFAVKAEKMGEESNVKLATTTTIDKFQDIELELGLFTEVYPIKERTQIDFLDEENLVIKKSGNDYFKYKIMLGVAIKLQHINSSSDDIPQSFYFRTINSTKFEIGDLYPTLHYPIGSETTMIFEKIKSY